MPIFFPSVEYFNNPKATSDCLDKDGWWHTGDLGLVDEDGYIFVLDRLKELIKYNAYQVAPAELEALLLSHPAVLDCAVIPYPDEIAGQIPMAFIVRQPGKELHEDELMDWVGQQVAPYKKVRKVPFKNAIVLPMPVRRREDFAQGACAVHNSESTSLECELLQKCRISPACEHKPRMVLL